MASKSKRYQALALLVSLLAIPAIACSGSSTTPTQAPVVKTATAESKTAEPPAKPADSAQATPTQPPAQAEASKPTETFLGDVIEQDGILLSALAVEDPTKPGILYQADAGKKLVAIEIIVGNISADKASVNPLSASLLDKEGFAYQPELGGRDGQIATLDLGPGEKVVGWVSFKVPTEAKLASLKYKPNLFAGNAMQIGLVAAPSGHTASKPSAERTKPQLAKLGDAVETNGVSLTAIKVDDPAKPGILYKQEEGKKLIAVEVVLGNVSADKLSANPLFFYLVDTDGFVYTAELGATDKQIDTVELGKGEKVKGMVAFTIPADAKVESVKFALPFASSVVQTGLSK